MTNVPPPEQPGHQPYPQAYAVGYTPPHGYPAYPPPPRVGRTPFPVPLAAALVWPIGMAVLLVVVLKAPADANALGRLAGFLTVPWLGSAVITWLIFRRRKVHFVVVLLVTLPFFFLLFGAALGAMTSS